MMNNNKKHRNNFFATNDILMVSLEECKGNPEKLVRKFLRKVHKNNVIRDCLERSRFIKPSQKKHNHDVEIRRKQRLELKYGTRNTTQ